MAGRLGAGGRPGRRTGADGQVAPEGHSAGTGSSCDCMKIYTLKANAHKKNSNETPTRGHKTPRTAAIFPHARVCEGRGMHAKKGGKGSRKANASVHAKRLI